MKTLFTLFFIIPLFVSGQFVINPHRFTGGAPPGDDRTPFVIWMGQSNVGYDSVGSMSKDQQNYYADTLNAKIWNKRAANPVWETMIPGANTAINDYSYATGLTMAASFTKKLNEANPVEAYVFQKGHGGSQLAGTGDNLNWSPTGTYGQDVFIDLDSAIAQATRAGKVLRLDGIFWVHGEDDGQVEAWANAYGTNLTTFRNRIDSGINAWATQYNQEGLVGDYKWGIFAAINSNVSAYTPTVRAAQKQHVLDNPTTSILINSEGFRLADDNLHYPPSTLLEGGNRGYNALYEGRYIRQPSVYDGDATTFFTTTSITDTILKIAVDTLVKMYKAAALWDSTYGLYPVIGGTAATHAVNLKSPGTYNSVFTGTWTHNSYGMKPAGNEKAATGIVPSAVLSQNNSSMGIYIGDNVSFDGYREMGSQQDLAVKDVIVVNYAGDTYMKLFTDGDYTVFPNPDSRAHFGSTRIGSAEHYGIRNGEVKASSTSVSGARPNQQILLGATNNSDEVANLGSYMQIRGAHIGWGRIPSKAALEYNAWQVFQSVMCRQW